MSEDINKGYEGGNDGQDKQAKRSEQIELPIDYSDEEKNGGAEKPAMEAPDDQHREIMNHLMDATIGHMVKVESTAAAIVAASFLHEDIEESLESLTDKILNTHRLIEARALLCAACGLMRMAGQAVSQKDINIYDGLSKSLVENNAENFAESFVKSVNDHIEKMSSEGESSIAVPPGAATGIGGADAGA